MVKTTATRSLTTRATKTMTTPAPSRTKMPAQQTFTTMPAQTTAHMKSKMMMAMAPTTAFPLYKTKHMLFSTTTNNNTIADTEHISAQANDGEYVAEEDPDDGQERLPFTVKDALLIKNTLIDSLREDENVKASLGHLGTANINAMLKQTQIENLVGSGTLSVIQCLATDGVITLPDIGVGTIAAQNFNTLYQLLQLQDETGVLKQKQDELWCVLMELTFGTDHVITQNVKISDQAAIKIATKYLEAVSNESFYKEVEERMTKYPIPAGGANPLTMKLAHEMRQMELTNIVSPILENIYSKYQYDGAEGYCLMKKAMEEHIANPEVVTLLNKAQQHIIDASGLDQHAILEN